jgi:erythromycin esterase-like protein
LATATLLAEKIRERSHSLRDASDLDPLLERIGDARCVLLGEASHGTSEYHAWRARISERLIREKGFSFIAVEGDWPDCYEVNRYVRGFPGSVQRARGPRGLPQVADLDVGERGGRGTCREAPAPER